MRTKIQIAFIAIFAAIIALPLLRVDLRQNKVSRDENRTLKNFPQVYNDDGSKNDAFNSDFESWLNDHIGGRSKMVLTNAKIQYHLFGKLANNSNYKLGENEELNYIGEKVLPNFEHTNLLSEDDLKVVVESYQTVSDYLKERGIQFYFIQNWDKQSIYPEAFPKYVNQFGTTSLADQVVNALQEKTDISVISMKETMLEGKKQYRTYNKWADVTHWSERGAFLGYQYLMQEINKRNENRYKVLNEDDYIIEDVDQGATLLGGIHQEDVVETFTVKDPKGKKTNEKLTMCKDADNRQSYWTNEVCGNNTKVLIFGDSYIQSFLMDDLAESFHDTIELWAWTVADLPAIIDEYKPDIVIYEKAEREPAYTSDLISAAQKIAEVSANK